MNFARTEHFKTAFQQLTERDSKKVEKALRLMLADLRHPSLRIKKVEGTDNIWEARASLSIRITFQIDRDTIILRNVGPHDKTLKHP